jgi:very-short-patch-repair endonuclease
MKQMKTKVRRVQEHNREVMTGARFRAEEMNIWPSPLEERMKEVLDISGIHYEQQKIFYIYADDGWIIRYYIADFYIPATNVIIEVDGKFHDDHTQHDRDRTKTIQENYPGVRVFRFRWNDFHDKDKMDELMGLLWDY